MVYLVNTLTEIYMIYLETQMSTCYTSDMARTASDKEKKTAMLTAKVPPTVKAAVTKIAGGLDRTESYIVLALVERGLEAFKRDGQLVEPQGKARGLKISQESVVIEKDKRVAKG